MRPDGVRERVKAVVEQERAVVATWVTRRMRVDLKAFIDSCALLYYSDHWVNVPLRDFREVEKGLADPTQLRTHSDFEQRCLAVVERLRPVVGPLIPRIGAFSIAEGDAVAPELVDVPPRTILGADEGRDRYFDLICWNQANSIAEGMARPYFAAARLSRDGVGFWRPIDRFGLVEPMTELRIRYEDEPRRRPDTAAEITAVLDEFRAAAPWPLPTG